MADSASDPAAPSLDDSFGEQRRRQQRVLTTWGADIQDGKEKIAFWAETRKVLAQHLPALLRALIAQLRSARRGVSTKEINRQVNRLQKLRQRAWLHPGVLAFRVEIAILWWRVHWLTIVAIVLGMIGLVLTLILLMFIALNLPDWIDQLRN